MLHDMLLFFFTIKKTVRRAYTNLFAVTSPFRRVLVEFLCNSRLTFVVNVRHLLANYEYCMLGLSCSSRDIYLTGLNGPKQEASHGTSVRRS